MEDNKLVIYSKYRSTPHTEKMMISISGDAIKIEYADMDINASLHAVTEINGIRI